MIRWCTQIKFLHDIQSFFEKLKEAYDLDSPRLSYDHKKMMFETLKALNSAAARIINANIENTHDIVNDDEEMFETDPEKIKDANVHKKFEEFLTNFKEACIIKGVHHSLSDITIPIIQLKQKPFEVAWNLNIHTRADGRVDARR